MSLRKTPLNAVHRALGARMVPFGGWDMPVQYTGVIEEHRTVRTKAGLFDVSHMGEIDVRGPQAAAVCQALITNDVGLLKENGQIIYSAVCYPEGGVVDDVLLHRMAADHYLFVVNASNIEKDFEFLRAHAPQGATLTNVSDEWAQLAVQGPEAEAILAKLTSDRIEAIPYYEIREGTAAGIKGLIARTGYTGEDGFEVYVPAAKAEALWAALMEAGTPLGMLPIGLGARDTLRLEMGYPLYGHELSAEITPLEAGLGWVTKLDKGADFTGSAALRKQKEQGVPRELIGLKFIERGVPRDGYPVLAGGEVIGKVTSGTQSPTLNAGVAMALVKRGAVKVGDPVAVEIRGKPFQAEVVRPPFVPSHVKRKAPKKI
jgi:aminomethyltransferase